MPRLLRKNRRFGSARFRAAASLSTLLGTFYEAQTCQLSTTSTRAQRMRRGGGVNESMHRVHSSAARAPHRTIPPLNMKRFNVEWDNIRDGRVEWSESESDGARWVPLQVCIHLLHAVDLEFASHDAWRQKYMVELKEFGKIEIWDG